MMTKEELKMLREYLVWRFMRNNINKYRQYCNEWIQNLHIEQLLYLQEEMKRLIKKGIYNI